MRHLPTIAAATVAAGLLLSSAPLAAQEWSGKGRLQGRVVDEQRKPVEGATITLRKGDEQVDPKKDGPAPLRTDKKGKWSTLGLGQGQWGILIEKEGYIPSEGRVAVNEFAPAQPIEVVLKKPSATDMAQAEAAAKAAEADTATGQAKAALDKANGLLTAARDPQQQASSKQNLEQARAAYLEGLAKLDEAKVEDPSLRVSIRRTVAGIDYELGRIDQAIADLKQVLELAPNDLDTLKLLVDLLVAAGKEAEAQTYMAKLPQGMAVDPNTLLNMGIKAFNDGDMDKAIVQFEQVVKQNPDLPDGYYYRGLVYLNQSSAAKGKAEIQRLTAAAKADFQKLLALAPNHSKAEEAREFLKSL